MGQGNNGGLLPNEHNWKPQRVYDYHTSMSFEKKGSKEKHWRMTSLDGRFDDVITLIELPTFIIRRAFFAFFMFLVNQIIGWAVLLIVIVVCVGTGGIGAFVILVLPEFGAIGHLLLPLRSWIFITIWRGVFLSWAWFRYFVGALLLPSIELRWVAEMIRKEDIAETMLTGRSAGATGVILLHHISNMFIVLVMGFLFYCLVTLFFPSLPPPSGILRKLSNTFPLSLF